MSVLFNENLLNDMVNKKVFASLKAVGEVIENEAKHRAPVDRGFLRGSITNAVYPNKSVRVSANTVYAVIQELGGIIKAKNSKGGLAVPVHKDAIKWSRENGDKSVREFPQPLRYIARKGKPALLVRDKEKGRNKRSEIMFVILKSVKIKPQPYLRPALLENKNKIMKVFAHGH